MTVTDRPTCRREDLICWLYFDFTTGVDDQGKPLESDLRKNAEDCAKWAQLEENDPYFCKGCRIYFYAWSGALEHVTPVSPNAA